ncbi:MAG: EamA family transporter [Bacteroidota bacterium]|nr:EamA family transporter [Bacteroidota bacterium]
MSIPKITKPHIALIIVCIVWGTTYLVNKIGVHLIPAFTFTAIRQLLAGGLILTYFFILKKTPFPSRQYLLFQLVLGLLMISIGNGIGTYGLKYIDSGVSAIFAAFSPIVIALLTIQYNPADRLNAKGWLGIFLGFCGMILICYDKLGTQGAESSMLGIILTVISVVSWGFGSVYSKARYFDVNPILSAGFQMFIGGIPLLIASLLFEKPWTIHFPMEIYFVWLYLIILGSVVAYSAYIYALKHLPATLVSIQSYINPIVAIFLGALFLKERVSINMLFGAGLTLLGVFLVNFAMFKKTARFMRRN